MANDRQPFDIYIGDLRITGFGEDAPVSAPAPAPAPFSLTTDGVQTKADAVALVYKAIEGAIERFERAYFRHPRFAWIVSTEDKVTGYASDEHPGPNVMVWELLTTEAVVRDGE